MYTYNPDLTMCIVKKDIPKKLNELFGREDIDYMIQLRTVTSQSSIKYEVLLKAKKEIQKVEFKLEE